MKKLFIILIVTVLLLLAASAFSFETAKTLTLPADGLRQLRVDSGAGRLKITGVDSLTAIEVTAEIYARGESEKNMADFIKDHVELSLEKRGDRAVLMSDIQGHVHLFFSGDAGINLTVRVPKSLALEIDDGSGSITVADGSGSIDIDRVGKDVIIEESGSGGVHIGKVDGRIIRHDRDDDEDDEDDGHD